MIVGCQELIKIDSEKSSLNTQQNLF